MMSMRIGAKARVPAIKYLTPAALNDASNSSKSWLISDASCFECTEQALMDGLYALFWCEFFCPIASVLIVGGFV